MDDLRSLIAAHHDLERHQEQFRHEFSRWLVGFRSQRGWSQRQLTRELGYINSGYITRIEQGTRPPSKEFLRRLSELAGG